MVFKTEVPGVGVLPIAAGRSVVNATAFALISESGQTQVIAPPSAGFSVKSCVWQEGGRWALRLRPLLQLSRTLAQGCEVDQRAADENRSDLERSLPGRDGSGDVVVFAQLRYSHARLPVEDLQIPGTT